jgi:hypothetical protein
MIWDWLVLARTGAFPRLLPGLVFKTSSPKLRIPQKTKGKASHKRSLAHRQPSDIHLPSDLQSIIDAWPELPEAIRAGIVAMVAAASKGQRR